MNNISSQSTNNTAINAEAFLAPISFINLLSGIYSLPIVSVIGFVLNVPCLIVLFHRKLKGDTFKYLIFKTLTHLGYLFIVAITPIFRCTTCPISLTLFAAFVNYYLNLCTLNPLWTYAAFVEIVLSYDRLMLLKQQKSKYLIKLRFWPTIISILVIGFVVNLPFMMAFRIQQIQNTQIWRYTRTDFGNSTFYRMYMIVYNIIQTLILLVVQIILNIMVKQEFGKYMKRKKNLTLTAVTSNLNKNSAISLKTSRPTKNNEPHDMSTVLHLSDFKDHNSKRTTATNAGPTNSSKKQQNESAELNFTLMIIVASLLFSLTRFVQLIYTLVAMISQQLGRSFSFTA
jgi:hypothetical protein